MLILPQTLTQSHCYISNHSDHQDLKQRHGWSFTLDEWCPSVWCRALFGAGGLRQFYL